MSYEDPVVAPKPANFEALEAAWHDPVQWAAEIRVYNAQLAEAGFDPVSEQMSYKHAEHVRDWLVKQAIRRGHG